jgi:hypothetical protein
VIVATDDALDPTADDNPLYPGLVMYRRALVAAVLVAATAITATACSSAPTAKSPAPASGSASAPVTRGTAPAAESAAAPTPTPTSSAHTTTAAQRRALNKSRLAKIIKSEPRGGVSVAAFNPSTGASFSAGANSGMRTASAYKLLVLIALILRDGSLSSGELPTATRAIENSDNVAGYSLFEAAGGNSGIESVLDKLGMTHTVPGQTDPTFTTTSARDYLKLLKVLVSKGGVLSASSRSLVLGLMRNVEADQRWGVGVAADKGTTFANKNGWLSIDDSNRPGETDNGLWAVTSVGVVTVGHHQVLMAVFTQHQKSFGAGVKVVQALARDLARTVAPITH